MALKNLSKRQDIIIKSADKGGAVVVWRSDLYKEEALRQLSDTSFYAKVEKDLTSNNQKVVKDTIQNLIVKQELPATATNLIITTPRTSCIYFLPKIHKPNNPGRPIVSACSCPTKLISSYLDKIMAPIVKSLPSYIKDSQHALEIFRDFNFLGEDKLIFTMDISSLYTVIPNSEGLQALRYFFDQRTVTEPSSETLLRLAELVLTLNCFSFAGNYYKQINGVAIGTKMGPSYANLFCRLCRAPVFQSVRRSQTWSLRSLHWRLHRRNFIEQRGTQSFYYFRQFFSPSSKIYLGNFRNFAGFSRYQSLYQWQRFMY